MSEYDRWAPIFDAWASDITEDVAYIARERSAGLPLELRLGAVRDLELDEIDVAGLEVEAVYGWFNKRAPADDSPELVLVTRKPA